MYEALWEPVLEKMKTARYISVLADSSTDCSVRDLELIYVRFLDNGAPRNMYVSVQELEHCHAKGHLAAIGTGDGQFRLIVIYATAVYC